MELKLENTGQGILILVPNSLLNRAKACRLEHLVPIQIEAYPRLSKKLLKRLRDERVIVMAQFAPFAKLVGEGASVDEYLGQGKLIIEVNDEEISSGKIPAHRNLDIIDRQANQSLLEFKINQNIIHLEFNSEVEHLKVDGVKRSEDLDALNEIGMALSTEKDLDSLLDLIVAKSRQMTLSDAGSLYLIESDPHIPEDQKDYFGNKKMRFQVAQNDSRQVPFKSFVVEINKSSIYGYVALNQEPLNFEDVYHIPENVEYGWGGREFDAAIGYRTMSMLTVPMVNWRGETIGVIQLINRKKAPNIILDDPETCIEHIQPFTLHDLRMAMSIASQASIAIQNTQLVDSIRTLFDGFIDASVKAIESRDPTTSGHSQRVATLTVALAEQVDRSNRAKFKDFTFNREQLQEIRYASLLHDFGKIGVREHVLVKAKKLFPHEMQSVEDRFELIRTLVTLKHSNNKLKAITDSSDKGANTLIKALDTSLSKELGELGEMMDFILRCNEPTVLAQGGFEQLTDVAKMIFKTMGGKGFPFLSEKELVSLSVPRGSLTEQDRKEIESHVTHTYRFLSAIPWTSDLRNVAEFAYAHHEKLDGTGYPNRLTEDKIPIQSKMMTIADIFDALTASDRPYKKALPAERALNILQEEAKASHIDADLLTLFISTEIFQEVLTP